MSTRALKWVNVILAAIGLLELAFAYYIFFANLPYFRRTISAYPIQTLIVIIVWNMLIGLGTGIISAHLQFRKASLLKQPFNYSFRGDLIFGFLMLGYVILIVFTNYQQISKGTDFSRVVLIAVFSLASLNSLSRVFTILHLRRKHPQPAREMPAQG